MNSRVALVTGASRGIGAAIAARFRQDDSRVLTPTRAELDLLSDESVDAFLAGLDVEVEQRLAAVGVAHEDRRQIRIRRKSQN